MSLEDLDKEWEREDKQIALATKFMIGGTLAFVTSVCALNAYSRYSNEKQEKETQATLLKVEEGTEVVRKKKTVANENHSYYFFDTDNNSTTVEVVGNVAHNAELSAKLYNNPVKVGDSKSLYQWRKNLPYVKFNILEKE